jgi:hypothetical protein
LVDAYLDAIHASVLRPGDPGDLGRSSSDAFAIAGYIDS